MKENEKITGKSKFLAGKAVTKHQLFMSLPPSTLFFKNRAEKSKKLKTLLLS